MSNDKALEFANMEEKLRTQGNRLDSLEIENNELKKENQKLKVQLDSTRARLNEVIDKNKQNIMDLTKQLSSLNKNSEAIRAVEEANKQV